VLGILLGLQVGLVIASVVAQMPIELQIFRTLAGIVMSVLLIARIWQTAVKRRTADD
jgi:heme A synthase